MPMFNPLRRLLLAAVASALCNTAPLVMAQQPIALWKPTTAKLPFTDGVAWRAAAHRTRNILIFEHGYRHAYVGTVQPNGDILDWRPNGLYPQTAGASGGSPFVAPVILGDTLIVPDYPQSWLARLDPDGNILQWSTAPSLNHPSNGYHAVIANGNVVYAIGGTYGLAKREVQMAELRGDGSLSPWVDLASLPTGLVAPQAEIVNGYLYVFGGEGDSGDLTPSRNVYRAKINEDASLSAWELKGSLLEARPHAAHLYKNGAIYTIGGGVQTTWLETNEFVPAEELGNLQASQFGPDYPIRKINGMGAAVVGQYGYIIGGNVAEGQRTDATYFTDFGTSQPPENALGPAKLWVGLKNSDDQGTQFDLRVELYKNSTHLLSAGEKLCVTGMTRNPNLAKEVEVVFSPVAQDNLSAGDQLTLTVLTRIGTNPEGTKCSGPGGSHNNATGLRLYFDSTNRPSRFGAAASPDPLSGFFLHFPELLDTFMPTGSVPKYQDSGAVNFAGKNPWKPIGSWSLTVP